MASPATNNSNSSTAAAASICLGYEWYVEAGKKANFICFYILSPIYFFLGIIFHSVCLKVYCIEVKTEKGYLYQIYLTVSRICETVFLSSMVVLQNWFAFDKSAATSWFRSCYACMWFALKIPPFFTNMSFVNSLLYTCLLGADRLYALWKPFSYRATIANRKTGPFMTLIFFIISIFVSVVQLIMINVSPDADPHSGEYRWAQNVGFGHGSFGQVLYQSRTVLESVGLVVLYVCNSCIVCLFRKRNEEAKKVVNRTSEMKKREEAEKTMTLLAFSQSMCLTITVTYRATQAVLISTVPVFFYCQRTFHTPILMSLMFLMDLLDFVCVFCANKRFRSSVLSALAVSKGVGTSAVTPIGPMRNT